MGSPPIANLPADVLELQELQQQLNVLSQQANQATMAEHLADALEYFHRALEVQDKYSVKSRELTERNLASGRAGILAFSGQVALLLGKEDEATRAFAEVLALVDEDSSQMARLSVATACLGRGHLFLIKGRFTEAAAEFGSSFEAFKALGGWEQAMQSRISMLDCELLSGQRESFLKNAVDCFEMAQDHQLASIQADVLLKVRQALSAWDAIGQLREALRRLTGPDTQLTPWLQAALKASDARRRARSGGATNLARAEELLREALALSEGTPSQLAGLRGDLANVLAASRRLPEAVHEAELGVEAADQVGVPALHVPALVTLSEIRWSTGDPAQRATAITELSRTIDALRTGATGSLLATALLERAGLEKEQPAELEAALKDVRDAAQAQGENPAELDTPLVAEIVLLGRLASREHREGRDEAATQYREQALEKNERLFAHLETQPLLPTRVVSTSLQVPQLEAWRDRLDHIERAASNGAWLCARLGRTTEAVDWAERGRSLLLRELMAASRLNGMATGSTSSLASRLVDRLSRKDAALAVFCVGDEETLVIVIDPGESSPQAHFAAFGQDSLRERIQSSANGIVADLGALTELSKQLLSRPLLNAVTRRRLLYVVPDSVLFAVPFAALPMDDGTQIIDHCAVAYLPAIGMMLDRQPVGSRRRSCLILAHQDEPGIGFAKYASEIAGLNWSHSEVRSPAHKADLLSAHAPVHCVHVASHGQLDVAAEPLAASWLDFGGGEFVTARDVIAAGLRLDTDLIFLNACMSGRFESELRSELEGFWRAFLQAGARALVGTLGYVDPDDAQTLAVEFYRAWLGGSDRAQALRVAQNRLRQKAPEPSRWASHVLVGQAN